MSGLQAVIIADDLTGALDAAAPFAMLGLHTVAATRIEGLAAALDQRPEVIAVTLNSREGTAQTARDRAMAATRLLLAAVHPGTLWLKKIDSRLKGHVTEETDAVAGLIRPHHILLNPAIPELGRIVRNGHLQGAGVDRPIPLPGAHPDAETDADLDRLVAGAAKNTLFVGARGLAAALARRLRPGLHPAAPPSILGPVTFVIGSRDPVTLAQVAQLRQHSPIPWTPAPDGVLPVGSPPGLLQATPGPGTDGPTVSRRLAEAVLTLPRTGTLLVTGGETAAALLRAANTPVLTVVGEVLPGLPLCQADGFPALITKSGGFGTPDTLLRLWQAAQNPESCPCP